MHVPAARASRVGAGVAVLLHGAGTTTSSPLLLGLAAALVGAGVEVVRVDQPYTRGPRRPPAPAGALDTVVKTVLAGVAGPVVLIGRSSGSRVAARVAAGVAATSVGDRAAVPVIAGLVALGYPLRPPGREPTRAGELATARAAELANSGVPILVVQGSRDAFGSPAEVGALDIAALSVTEIAGADHGFDLLVRDGRRERDVAAEVAGVVVPVVLAWLADS